MRGMKIAEENAKSVEDTKHVFFSINKDLKDLQQRMMQITTYTANVHKHEDEIFQALEIISSTTRGRTGHSTEEVSASTQDQLDSIEQVADLSKSDQLYGEILQDGLHIQFK